MAAEEFISKIPTIEEADLLAAPITSLETLKSKACEKMKYKMELYVTYLQTTFVNKLSEYETEKKFVVDRWNREKGGGGITCVLQEGNVFEKAGVNMSAMWGEMSEEHVKALRSRGKDISLEGTNNYFTTGMTCILQAVNPFVPTFHINIHFFEVIDSRGKCTWWFGCSANLMPNYLCEKDFTEFHDILKSTCDQLDECAYEKYKKCADDYNYNVHRDEHCGIGGIFVEDLFSECVNKCFSFIASCGDIVFPLYLVMVDRHIKEKYTEDHVKWQHSRRGRYVEYVLCYGRGTKFGLRTPGVRIESVLITMPLIARWEYMPVAGSEEEAMLEVLKKPKQWISTVSSR